VNDPTIDRMKAILSAALEERRGIVVYSRLDAVEMDRLARRVERDALERLEQAFPAESVDQRILGLRNRLKRMQDELADLGEQGQIREQSRQMQNDEIVWQAFEDIAWMLGVQ